MAKRILSQLLLTTTSLVFVATTMATDITTAQTPPPVTATPMAVVATPTVDPAPTAPSIIPTAPLLNSSGFVLMDANSGMVLAQKNMNEHMAPASLTKLMTLYIASAALKNGQIKLTDNVLISKKAWQTGGSRMFVKVGTTVSVEDLIKGVIVASGNDACVALAEFIGGNEQTFVTMMNQGATQLGMKDSHFMDSNGLPDPGHYSTPYDLALLSRAIITQFPQDYTWYKQKWITYNNIKQPNRNRLLWRDNTVDGLKTGHTQEAGYCLIASALRHGMRLISVVMGASTDEERASDSEALLNWGFRFYKTHKLFDANQSLATPRVFLGRTSTVSIGLASPLYVTIQTGAYAHLKPKVDINTKLQAPIKKGQVVGTLNIQLHKKTIVSAPLIALANDPKGNIFSRAWDHLTGIF